MCGGQQRERSDRTGPLECRCRVNRMNFAAQFFYANFVNDGTSPQETRRTFNDSEEYDPFWQRWDRAESSLCREPASQNPLGSESCDTAVVSLREHVALPRFSPSHPETLAPAPKTLETPKPAVIRRPDTSPSSSAREHTKSPRGSPAPPARYQSEVLKADEIPSVSSAVSSLLPHPENNTLLSLLQTLVYILLKLFLSFLLLFLPR